MSGDASGAEGPLFYVTNSTGTITLSGVELDAGSRVLTGDIQADAHGTATLTLSNASTWAGALDADHTAASTSVTLDASSTWTLTGDSYVGTMG